MPNAELHVSIGEAGDLADTVAPFRKCLLAFARVGADRERAADMVEHDGRLREGARLIRNIAQLRMEQPRVEGEPERGEPGEPFAEITVAVEPLRGAGAIDRKARILVPGRAIADAFEPPSRDRDVLLEDAF